ncbi:MAG: long-chain fatty acid--CoA ligase [Ruminococcaceae bacterium]|nr:long-chain fatty acid--CoA ligase [Oscillospiraceae bacterium]
MNLEAVYTAPKFDLVKDYINEAVKNYGDNDAFVIKERNGDDIFYRHISYSLFSKQLREFGCGLLRLGLGGKRIAVIGANSYEWLLTYISVISGVGIIVPLDKELTESELMLSLKRSKADAVVFDSLHGEKMIKLAEGNELGIKHFISTKKLYDSIPCVNEIIEQGTLYSGTEYDDYSPDPDEMATIIFTSGTTSASKAVMLSNRNIAANLFDLLSTEKVYPTDRNLLFLPLHHTFGSTGALFFLSSGATNMFCDGLRYIQKNLREYKITTFVCVPLLLESMHRAIIANIEKKGMTAKVNLAKKLSGGLQKLHIDVRRKLFKPILDELGGELRFIISGASAIKRNVAKGFNDFGILTVQGYGLTETSPVLAAENVYNMRYGSVGKVFPSVEITIEDPNEDGIGEIVAKAPNVMLGYYEMPDETAAVLKDGKFYTGDLGRIDKDGFLYITGRKKNVIVLKSGKNVYPEELESTVSKLPYASEVLIYGKTKGDNFLIALKLVYNPAYFKDKYGDIGEEDIAAKIKEDITAINEDLPPYKHIKHIDIQTTPMVKTSTAKIKRHEEITQ